MCVTKKVQYLNRTYSSSIVTTFLVIFNTHTIWTKNVPIYFWLNPFFIFLKNCIYYIIVYWTIYIYMKPCMPLIRYLGSVLHNYFFLFRHSYTQSIEVYFSVWVEDLAWKKRDANYNFSLCIFLPTTENFPLNFINITKKITPVLSRKFFLPKTQ